MTRQSLLATLLALFTFAPGSAQVDIIYTGTAQPSLESATITGAQRGTTVNLEVNGINLGGASGVIFDKPGFTVRILAFAERLREKPKAVPQTTVIVDKSTVHRVTIEVAIAASVEPEIYRFRLMTPMGSTNSLPFEARYESIPRDRAASLAAVDHNRQYRPQGRNRLLQVQGGGRAAAGL
jgi:hypothetical protein